MKPYAPDEKLMAQIELYESMQGSIDEVANRRMLALMAESGGRGAQHYIAQRTHTDPKTIERGRKELHQEIELPESGRVRLEGAGRKTIASHHPEIFDCIHQIIDDHTYGDPMKPLSWTTLSEGKISQILEEEYGIKISPSETGVYLKQMGYSLQQNRKMLQVGTESPDRDTQFQIINDTARDFLQKGLPVISIDAKKKENLGNFSEFCRNL